MVNNVTSLQWKLISKKSTHKRNLILITIIVSLILLLLIILTWNSCGVKHIVLLNDVSNYEKTLDPEFCDALIFKIENFNEQCQPEIEILDCG